MVQFLANFFLIVLNNHNYNDFIHSHVKFFPMVKLEAMRNE